MKVRSKKVVECNNGHKHGVAWEDRPAPKCPIEDCGLYCGVNHVAPDAPSIDENEDEEGLPSDEGAGFTDNNPDGKTDE